MHTSIWTSWLNNLVDFGDRCTLQAVTFIYVYFCTIRKFRFQYNVSQVIYTMICKQWLIDPVGLGTVAYFIFSYPLAETCFVGSVSWS